MGNNIKQKNLAFSFEKKTGIPYGDLKYVSLDDNRSVDNSLNVNNTTEQLVDNDIFIENQINFNKNRRVGPKSGDEESIYNGPDGYKYWDKEGGSFDIYHKKDHDVQSTFRRLSEFTSVNLLVKINDSSVLVCENGKTSVGNLDFRDMSFQRVTYAQHDVTVRCKS